MKNEMRAKSLICFWLSDVVFLSSAQRIDADILTSAGNNNNIAPPKTDEWLSSPSHFDRFSSFSCSFCSLIKGITLKVRMLCFVLINSVLLNLVCVWIL